MHSVHVHLKGPEEIIEGVVLNLHLSLGLEHHLYISVERLHLLEIHLKCCLRAIARQQEDVVIDFAHAEFDVLLAGELDPFSLAADGNFAGAGDQRGVERAFLADLGKQYHLAVSLHAPNDELRNRIVPTNIHTGITDILAAADYFFEKTGRQVTYEYVLLHGINDGVEQAAELARLLRGRNALINLIPFNDVKGLPYRRPTQEALTAFVDRLRQGGVTVKVRKRKGSEIDAACGQLRRSALGEAPLVH